MEGGRRERGPVPRLCDTGLAWEPWLRHHVWAPWESPVRVAEVTYTACTHPLHVCLRVHTHTVLTSLGATIPQTPPNLPPVLDCPPSPGVHGGDAGTRAGAGASVLKALGRCPAGAHTGMYLGHKYHICIGHGMMQLWLLWGSRGAGGSAASPWGVGHWARLWLQVTWVGAQPGPAVSSEQVGGTGALCPPQQLLGRLWLWLLCQGGAGRAGETGPAAAAPRPRAMRRSQVGREPGLGRVRVGRAGRRILAGRVLWRSGRPRQPRARGCRVHRGSPRRGLAPQCGREARAW